jgi:hypothetical protein
MMVNGKILCAFAPQNGPNYFAPPTSYYEFDYLANTFTQIDAPDGGTTSNEPCYFTGMLDLPDGNVLYADQYSNQYYIYTPDGSPLEEGKPTIDGIFKINCDTFMAVGTLFNGISEGATYGDDWQMNTNYPIIRLTEGDNVYYARSFNWNRTGVQTGELADTTYFTLPDNLPNAIFSLVVVANGIASDTVTFAPYPILSSSLNPPDICSNTLFAYSATSDDTAATFTWIREAVAGISNTEILDPQSSDPNEILINTTTDPVTVVYEYTITSGNCSNTVEVSVVVNPSPSISITGITSICEGASTTLTADGGASYEWNTGDTTASITVSPIETTTYTVTSSNSYGCIDTSFQEVAVHAAPEVDFTGLPDTACTYTEGLPLTGIPEGGTFSGTGMVGNIFSPAGAELGENTITYVYTDSFGCEGIATQVIYVSLCTGIETVDGEDLNSLVVYPNPASEGIHISFTSQLNGTGTLRIIDVLGRNIKSEVLKISTGQNSASINLEEIAKGDYIILLQNGNNILKEKVSVE